MPARDPHSGRSTLEPIVMENPFFLNASRSSVTRTVNVNVPAVVGVQEMVFSSPSAAQDREEAPRRPRTRCTAGRHRWRTGCLFGMRKSRRDVSFNGGSRMVRRICRLAAEERDVFLVGLPCRDHLVAAHRGLQEAV